MPSRTWCWFELRFQAKFWEGTQFLLLSRATGGFYLMCNSNCSVTVCKEENLHKHKGTEEFWRVGDLSWAESFLLLKPVIHYTASCSILQKARFRETCLDGSFHCKELRETMCFSTHGVRAHGYMARSGRKQGINDGRNCHLLQGGSFCSSYLFC